MNHSEVRRENCSSPDSGTTTYQYNAAGQLSQKTDARSVTTKYAYDNVNRLTAKYFGTNPGDNAQDVQYTYDQNDSAHGKGKGRLTSIADNSGGTNYKYNALGLVTEKKVDPTGSVGVLTTTYAYNSNGALTQITYPGGRVVAYTRSNGRLSDMTLHYASSSTLDVDVIGYQAFGGVKQYTRAFENAETIDTTRSFTSNGLLQTLEASLSVGGSVDLAYEYDAFNNIAHIDNTSNPGTSQTFVYDALQRLTKATGVYGRYTYDYDAVGNRSSATLERASPTAPTTFNEIFTETYSYQSGTNRLNSILREDSSSNTLRERELDYDAAGNRTGDRKTIYVPGTSTVESDKVIVPSYGNQNRMDSVTPVNCVTNPTHSACL